MKKSNRHAYWIFCLTAISALAVYFMLPHRLGRSQEPESPGAVFMVTTAADNGAGSFRQAILDANAAAGTDTINFQIGTGVVEINADTALPIITQPVVIDGATQPGFSGTPLIIVRRNNAPVAAHGLQISGGGSTIKGLSIIRFNNGVMLESAGGNSVTGCFIGLDPRDETTTASSNSGNGMLIMNSPNNQIGGNTPPGRNVIGRNTSDGIEINGAGATGNVVTGNYVGLRSNGSDLARNGSHGVFIDGAPNNNIGGTTAGERNVISGNTDPGVPVDLQAGVRIVGTGAAGNVVRGNFIGTDVTGTLVRSNSFGVFITGAPNNTIGGTVGTTPGGACTGACNLVSGNRREAIQIFPETESVPVPGTVIEGNFVNLNPAGTSLLVPASPIGQSISVLRAPNTRVGGSSAAARNVVVNNNPAASNLIIVASSDCIVTGNFIGTDTTGTSAIGNASAGVTISQVPGPTGQSRNNRIGGTTAGERNLISGGNQTGVVLGSSLNTVQGNYIGTDVTGALDLGNTLDGVSVFGNSHIIGTAAGTTLGGACTGGCNVISGNNRDGVRIDGFHSGHRIDYNYIGLNAEGLAALRNGSNAISLLNGANNNVIGRLPTSPPPIAVEAENAPNAVYCIQDDVTGDFVTINDETNECTITRCRTGETQTASARIQITPGGDINFGSTQLGLAGYIAQGSRQGYVFDSTPGRVQAPLVNDTDIANSSCTCPTEGDQLLTDGVEIAGDGSVDNIGHRCFFGFTPAGAPLDFGLGGAYFVSASGNRISSNLIATDSEDAIDLLSGTGTEIYDNLQARLLFSPRQSRSAALVPIPSLIDLNDNGILDPNDAQDPDGGANRTQNNPENLVLVRVGEDDFRLTGNFNSTPNGTFDIRLYGQSTALGAGGQGILRIYPLGTSFQIGTDANGDAAIDRTFTSVDAFAIRTGDSIAATATVVTPVAQRGDTSELSSPADVPGVTVSGRVTTPNGTGLRNAVVSITDNVSGIRRTAITSSFGFYNFDDVSVLRRYTIAVSSKRYRFASQTVDVSGDLFEVDFIGLE